MYYALQLRPYQPLESTRGDKISNEHRKHTKRIKF
jgi:hypothetical protein